VRFVALLGAVGLAAAATPGSTLWTELNVKREGLPSVHQEFEVTRVFQGPYGTQSWKGEVVIDLSRGRWRERIVSGTGDPITIFDGHNLFRMEEGGHEYVRIKRQPKDDNPVPSPYAARSLDFSKARELGRRPCGIPQRDQQCVVLEMPLKTWTRPSSHSFVTLVQGTERIVLDAETGVALGARTVEVIDNHRGGYQSEITYELKQLSYGASEDASLIQLPSNNLREVKELPKWNAARVKKDLVGKTAPDLAVTDLQGKPVTLSALKGRTVLLDFWTTWCPPCRADAPALHNLYRRYGDRDLTIISFSVDEDRETVEKFLEKHPVDYSVVLTTENEMPRPYQVGILPTYMIIDRNGTLTAAAEGDKGFGALRKLLKKAGLETK
jgi:cytochrome c biogenesis protein CcmG, thiol:disulfide interchange protein DsbE